LVTGHRSIEMLEYWGEVSGEKLMEWDVDGKQFGKLDPYEEYEVSAALIGRHVIRAVLNPDPLGKRPYSKSSFENVPGSFWGLGVVEKMRDVQAVCNATVRALVNNMGLASGPQIVINDINRLAEGEAIDGLEPFKIWQFIDQPGGSTRPAIDFFQPNPLADVLVRVYEFFKREADDYTMIPAYSYGSDEVAGAGKTATGLSMLMSSAAKGIRKVIANIDRGAIKPLIRRHFTHVMLYDEDQSVKGDVKIVAKGALSLVLKEQMQVRRLEALERLNNPIDLALTGLKGRAELHRRTMDSLDVDPDKIIKTDEEIAAVEQAQQAAAQAEQQGLQEQSPDVDLRGANSNQGAKR